MYSHKASSHSSEVHVNKNGDSDDDDDDDEKDAFYENFFVFLGNLETSGIQHVTVKDVFYFTLVAVVGVVFISVV